jgi:hypothetical protein
MARGQSAISSTGKNPRPRFCVKTRTRDVIGFHSEGLVILCGHIWLDWDVGSTLESYKFKEWSVPRPLVLFLCQFLFLTSFLNFYTITITIIMVGRLEGKNAIVTGAAGYVYSHRP